MKTDGAESCRNRKAMRKNKVNGSWSLWTKTLERCVKHSLHVLCIISQPAALTRSPAQSVRLVIEPPSPVQVPSDQRRFALSAPRGFAPAFACIV